MRRSRSRRGRHTNTQREQLISVAYTNRSRTSWVYIALPLYNYPLSSTTVSSSLSHREGRMVVIAIITATVTATTTVASAGTRSVEAEIALSTVKDHV